MKWFLSIAIVLLVALAFAPRANLATERAAFANTNNASTATPYPSPPLVFVPLHQLDPFPTIGAENTTRTPNRVSLRARAHFPKPGAQQVSPDSLISILFNAPMDAASVESRFRVMRGDTGARVDGYFEWKNNIAVFYPVPLLESDVEYRVVLEPGARTADGMTTLRDKIEWTFSTGELVAPFEQIIP